MTTLPAPMPDARFWQLMTHIDRPLLLSGQDDESLAPLRAALTQLPADDIIAFALRLADRLAALLTASRARTGPFGDDGLLYAACHAVARGQAWFEASMRWPAMFDDADADPDTSWCESLLYVAREAWSQDSGADEDDFPVWTLEEGLAPFAGKLPASTAGDAVRRPATSPTAYTVYASFEQHPGIARHVEPEENVRVTLAGLLDDYFWCLLDLDDYLGIVNEQGQSFQILHDASKNLYWAEVPCEADKASYGQEFSREALLDLLHRLPANFDRAMFEAPQKLAWDE